jgi:hypothetical protein
MNRRDISPAHLLMEAVTLKVITEIEEDRDDILTCVVFFDKKTRETELIHLFCPDEFLEEVVDAYNKRWDPMAIETCEDNGEAGYPNLRILYLDDSIETEAIVNSMFVEDEKSLMGETTPPLQRVKLLKKE